MSKISKPCSKLIKTLKNQQCDRPTDRRTDGPTDQRTNKVTYRVACTQLKSVFPLTSTFLTSLSSLERRRSKMLALFCVAASTCWEINLLWIVSRNLGPFIPAYPVSHQISGKLKSPKMMNASMRPLISLRSCKVRRHLFRLSLAICRRLWRTNSHFSS